jgi:outer membrane murein-binding lipoprotein Lpp
MNLSFKFTIPEIRIHLIEPILFNWQIQMSIYNDDDIVYVDTEVSQLQDLVDKLQKDYNQTKEELRVLKEEVQKINTMINGLDKRSANYVLRNYTFDRSSVMGFVPSKSR